MIVLKVPGVVSGPQSVMALAKARERERVQV